MKIAVPWPVKESSQHRVREALGLWEDKSVLVVCLVEPSQDPFLDQYDTCILPRDSTSVGTDIPKCFIYDMVKAVRDKYPNEDFYGFGNSDCVPVGDILEGHTDFEVLVYHRTDIKEWEYRIKSPKPSNIGPELADMIWNIRQEGIDDRKIARHLNLKGCPPPEGEQEWTYLVIRNVFEDQGAVFFWGQDLYLFRADVVDSVLENYLKPKDPILGTGGFDPRLTKWCLDNYKGARVLNKIFHKSHVSEWTVNEVEYAHNGGDIPVEDHLDYYDQTFIMSLCEQGQKGAIPKYIKYMLGRKEPHLNEILHSGKHRL